MLETELDWFIDYLFNRHQTVIYDCHKSKRHPVFCGVPQGSILGPLLFVAYINDLPGVLMFSNIIMYADDTILFYSHKNMNDIQEGLDKDMNAVASWLNQNQLVINLNRGKTESMIFGTSQKLRKEGNPELTISVGANQIRSTSSYKYLGVQLDPTLSFNQHLNCVRKKAAGKIKVLKKVRSSLTLHAAQAVYQFMIAPTMAYSHFVYLELSNSYLAKFQSLENQAKKVILNGLRNESVALKIRDFKLSCIFDSAIMVFKSINNLSCDLFNGYFSTLSHQRSTKNNGIGIALPKVKLESARKGFYFQGGLIYNNLPLDIRQLKSIVLFRNALNGHLSDL